MKGDAMMRIMMGPEEQVVLHLLWLRWCDGDSVSGVVTRPPCQVCLPVFVTIIISASSVAMVDDDGSGADTLLCKLSCVLEM